MSPVIFLIQICLFLLYQEKNDSSKHGMLTLPLRETNVAAGSKGSEGEYGMDRLVVPTIKRLKAEVQLYFNIGHDTFWTYSEKGHQGSTSLLSCSHNRVYKLASASHSRYFAWGLAVESLPPK